MFCVDPFLISDAVSQCSIKEFLLDCSRDVLCLYPMPMSESMAIKLFLPEGVPFLVEGKMAAPSTIIYYASCYGINGMII